MKRGGVRPWRVVRAAAGVTAATLLLAPAQLALRALRPHAPPYVARLFHRLVLRSLGVEVVIASGRPSSEPGTLFVANHLSWVDVSVLGSKLLASFVARHDLAGWPLLGWLADQQRSVYVDRGRRTTVAEQGRALAARLEAGDSLILFPEGTAGDGRRVLPFRPALLSVAEQLPDAPVQPITLAYPRVNGLPVTAADLPRIAWVGDVGLARHALDFVRLGRVEAELRFHEPVRGRDFAGRKALARHCEQVIAAGYVRAVRGC